jgi:addiction module HigA family antidote
LIDQDIPVEQVAIAAGILATKLLQVLDGQSAIDADMDIRLARYFGMSEGFFLRLQNCFDLEEVRRQNGAELDLIIRRAA